MISLQKNFLFIHVPKTGGNSLQNILKEYSEDDIVILGNHQDGLERFEVTNKLYSVTKHSTLSHYRSVIDKKTFKGLFKFAAIRNPWERMVSSYFSPHRGIMEWDRYAFMRLISATPTLRHYIFCSTFKERIFLKTRMPRIGEAVTRDIDFLLRFEKLESDFSELCRKLNIPGRKFPHINVSNRAHYSEYYDNELIDAVAERFSEEIELGQYRFERA
jgi:hypothetical protein